MQNTHGGKDTEAHKTWTEKFSKPFAESKRRNVDGFDSEMKGMEKVVIEDLKIKKKFTRICCCSMDRRR